MPTITFLGVVYYFVPPLLTAIFMLYLTRTFKANDDKKIKIDQETLLYKRRLEDILVNIQKQNNWIIRKFVELGSAHNINHPNTQIDWNDYPDVFRQIDGE